MCFLIMFNHPLKGHLSVLPSLFPQPGEGSGFSRRIYLLYDGVHYDSLVREPYPGAQATYDITKFDVDDEVTKRTAVALAAELKQHRQYVDLAAGTLRCSICDKLFKGQVSEESHTPRLDIHMH